jgi:hypothetical protein
VQVGDRVYFQSYFQPDLIPGTIVRITPKKIYIEHGDVVPYRSNHKDVYLRTPEREEIMRKIRALDFEMAMLRIEMRK